MSIQANVLANFLGQGWNALMGIAFIPLYVRYLGLESYGLLGVYALIQGWLALLDLGMASTLSREMALFKAGDRTPRQISDLLRSLELVALLVCFGIFSTIFLAVDWLVADWLQVGKLDPLVVSEAITMMGGVVGLRLIEGLYRGAIIGLQEQVWLNLMSAFLATARWGGAAAILAFGMPTIEAYFYWQGGISVVSVLIFAVYTHRAVAYGTVHPRFSLGALRSVFGFAAGVSLSTVLAILLTQIDKLLLSKLLTLEDFGRYTFAATLAGALLQMVVPVSHAYYPRYSELVARADSDGLAATYHGGAQLAHLILAPVALTLAIFALPLIHTWSGNQELAASTAGLVSLLAIGTLLNGIMQTPYALTLAYGWSSLSARLNLVAVSIIVPILLWVVPKYGAYGAAWVWLLLNAGYVAVGVHFVHAKVLPSEKLQWYIDDLLIPVLVAGAVLGLAMWFNPAPSIPFIVAAYLMATGAMAFSSSRIRPSLVGLMKMPHA